MTHSTPTQHQAKPSFMHRLTDLVIRLAEPAAVVPARDYHRIRLLTLLLIIFIPLSAMAFGLTLLDQKRAAGLEITPLLYLILTAVLLLMVTYALSRTKYYGPASKLVVGVITGAVLASAWIQKDTTNLYFLAVGILLSSLFQSWRDTLFWLVVIVV